MLHNIFFILAITTLHDLIYKDCVALPNEEYFALEFW